MIIGQQIGKTIKNRSGSEGKPGQYYSQAI
jgi:hypothetical protein